MDGGEKTFWIIANWKSNKNIDEALGWVKKVGSSVERSARIKIVVCPTFSCLSEIKKIIVDNNFPVMLGSQDLSPFSSGAYTGEESANLLKDLVELSIIGHSERRENFHEDDEMIAKKVKQALENNITPLVCIQDENIPIPEDCKLVAYEPIWAIGSDTPDTPENSEKVAKMIKNKYGDLQVLYGGSVNSENIKGFLSQDDINGALIGGASLDADEFIKICKIVSEGL